MKFFDKCNSAVVIGRLDVLLQIDVKRIAYQTFRPPPEEHDHNKWRDPRAKGLSKNSDESLAQADHILWSLTIGSRVSCQFALSS